MKQATAIKKRAKAVAIKAYYVLKKIWHYRKSKRVLFGFILFILLVVLASISLVDRNHINDTKLQALLKKEDCSTSAVKSVAKYKPSTKQLPSSIDLLKYRSLCKPNDIPMLKQIVAYDNLAGRTDDASNFQSQIDRIQVAESIMARQAAAEAASGNKQ